MTILHQIFSSLAAIILSLSSSVAGVFESLPFISQLAAGVVPVESSLDGLVNGGQLPAPSDSISVVSPMNSSRLNGTVTLQAKTSLTGVVKVRFLINGRNMYDFKNSELTPVEAVSPFIYPWHSANVWDGETRIQAAALDASGKIMAVSHPVVVAISNRGVNMNLVSPKAGETVSGKISWTVETDFSQIDGFMFYVDGERQTIAYTTNKRPTFNLDTTKFSNGPHELFVGLHAAMPGNPPMAMAQAVVNFDNGKTLMEVRPKYKDIFLIPGESVNIAARLIYTNSDEATADASYNSSNTAVASVDSQGNVKAGNVGTAKITVSAGGKTSIAYVTVLSKHIMPHFSKDGKILTSYDSSRSTIFRSLYSLDANELGTIGLGSAVQTAGVNAMETGIFRLPQDAGNATNFATYKEHDDRYWERALTTASRYNLSLVMTGDNMARNPESLYHSLNTSWAPEAIKYDFTKARDSGKVIAIEMIDESSGMWGNTPTPNDGRWQNKKPPIPDDAFTRLMNIINQVPDRTPISWPILWSSGAEAARNWMGNPNFSNYGSLYWDPEDWRRLYPRGWSLPQYKNGMDNVSYNYWPVLQREKPLIMNISLAGPYYDKNSANSSYTPGADRLIDGGHWGESVSAQIMYAMTRGAVGLRGYQYDWSNWKNERANSPIGSRDRQTGSDPWNVGPGRWQAMSTSFNLIEKLEPLLLQPRASALDLGPRITTGARKGSQGTLFMAINFSEMSSSVKVDTSAYFGSGSVTRYNLLGSKIATKSVKGGVESLVLKPGETVIWTSNSILDPLPEPTPEPEPEPAPVPTPTPTPTPAPQPEPEQPVGTSNSNPDFALGINLSGPSVTIDGNLWRSDSLAKALGFNSGNSKSYSGSYKFNLNPATDSDTKSVLENVYWTSDSNTLSLSQSLPNGSYRVYLWVVENYRDNFRSMNVKLEGQLVASKVGELSLGSWRQIGPYLAEVKDGTLNIEMVKVKGDPLLAGLAVFNAQVTTAPAPEPTPTPTPEPVPTPDPEPAPAPKPVDRFLFGVNLNGGAVSIEGKSWRSDAEARSLGLSSQYIYKWSGTYNFNLNPVADSNVSDMLRSVYWSPDGRFIVKQSVANGDYEVYLWVIENYRDNFRNINAKMEGEVVASGIGDMSLGSWKKYGPYKVKVSDGELTMEISKGLKGDALLAGFAIYSAE